MSPEFDRYSGTYDQLLHDPIRERFSGGGSQFFHLRKRDLIRDHLRSRKLDGRAMSYLDVGCGKGELLSLLRDDFGSVAGCDPSSEMLSCAAGINTRVQSDPARLPYDDASFDFVTAVCVYHHVPPAERLSLSREVARVLRPGGTFAIVEHNPLNPVTRLIVSRTPVDADAILLRSAEARATLAGAGFTVVDASYFLFFPASLYKLGGRGLELLLQKIPLGGQYAVFATKAGTSR
jgi:SAM-dependent methyltransferase